MIRSKIRFSPRRRRRGRPLDLPPQVVGTPAIPAGPNSTLPRLEVSRDLQRGPVQRFLLFPRQARSFFRGHRQPLAVDDSSQHRLAMPYALYGYAPAGHTMCGYALAGYAMFGYAFAG